MDDKLSQATDLIRQWYYEEIRQIADSAITACHGRLITVPTEDDLANVPRNARASAREGFVPYRIPNRVIERSDGITVQAIRERSEGTDVREFLREWVDSVTDDHQFVIYTYKAKAALLASDNEDAYAEEIGETAPTVEVACCYAMRADVWQLLEARSDEWDFEDPSDDDEPAVPSCVASMGCLCAAHARGRDASEECDATEQPRFTPAVNPR